MSLIDRLTKNKSAAAAEDVAKALGLSNSGIAATVPKISATKLFKQDAIERALSGKPKKVRFSFSETSNVLCVKHF